MPVTDKAIPVPTSDDRVQQWVALIKSDPVIRAGVDRLIDAVLANHRTKCRLKEAAAVEGGVIDGD